MLADESSKKVFQEMAVSQQKSTPLKSDVSGRMTGMKWSVP